MFTLFTCTHIHLRPHGGDWIYSYWVLFTFWDTCKCFKFVDRPDGNTFLLQLLTVKVSDNLCFYVSSRSVDLLISSGNLWYFYARLLWNCYYRALFDCHFWTAALLSLANCCFVVDIFIVLMLMLLLLLFYYYYCCYYYYCYYYYHYYYCYHYYHFIVISYLLFIFIVIFLIFCCLTNVFAFALLLAIIFCCYCCSSNVSSWPWFCHHTLYAVARCLFQ